MERSGCLVRCPDGPLLVSADSLPAVGDWVAVRRSGTDRGRVDAVLDRWSALIRQDPAGDRHQVLAANLDLVLVVVPTDRLNLARVERELLVAWESGAVPVVVLTKTDLVDAAAVRAPVEHRLSGADVIVTSARTGVGIAEVARALQPNRSAVLIGPSGAGKSSLANALLGEDAFATGDVRSSDRRGRHTTTARHLVPVPSGGVLIDTPGLRSLALWRGDRGLAATFADVEQLASACRFADCRHDREPGCTVKEAVDTGRLERSRLDSYRKLLREVAFAERAHDPRSRRAEQQRWKAITKAQRRGRSR